MLLEVNASGEANKHGFAPEEVPRLAPALAELKHVRVDGLMTMAAYEEDAERTPADVRGAAAAAARSAGEPRSWAGRCRICRWA